MNRIDALDIAIKNLAEMTEITRSVLYTVPEYADTKTLQNLANITEAVAALEEMYKEERERGKEDGNDLL